MLEIYALVLGIEIDPGAEDQELGMAGPAGPGGPRPGACVLDAPTFHDDLSGWESTAPLHV